MPVAPGEWSLNAFRNKIIVGKYSPAHPEGRLFKGKIACLQLFDKSLTNAEIVKSMSNCHEKTKLQNDKSFMKCPEGWEIYQENCYQISVTNMPFRRAEVKCINSVSTLVLWIYKVFNLSHSLKLLKVEDLYRSSLVWTEEPGVLDFLAALAKSKSGIDQFWIGLDDRLANTFTLIARLWNSFFSLEMLMVLGKQVWARVKR